MNHMLRELHIVFNAMVFLLQNNNYDSIYSCTHASEQLK